MKTNATSRNVLRTTGKNDKEFHNIRPSQLDVNIPHPIVKISNKLVIASRLRILFTLKRERQTV